MKIAKWLSVQKMECHAKFKFQQRLFVFEKGMISFFPLLWVK